MRIHSLTLKNVKSFQSEAKIDFKHGLNIFIGPNGGGKSNLLDIINIVLGYYFIYPWRIDESPTAQYDYKIQNMRDTVFNPINKALDKNILCEDEDQEINIDIEITEEDIKNLNTLKNNQDKMLVYEKQITGQQYFNTLIFPDEDMSEFVGQILEYKIINHSEPSVINGGSTSRLFLDYLKHFELYSLLIEMFNNATVADVENVEFLHQLTLYISPYRNQTIQNFQIQLSNKNRFDLVHAYKKNTSKDISGVLDYASFYFALKMRNFNDSKERFKADEEVQFVIKYLHKLGYDDFDLSVLNKQKNLYEIILKKNGQAIEISKASSGEREIINLLLGLFAFNVKGGIVIIDEPELHLHPRWQKLLLELFSEISSLRKIDFFIVTHSPHFISTESIKSTLRIYKQENNSYIINPDYEKIEQPSVKDIFQVVNVLNNEKIFFADKVLLVEGVVDRIIYEKILRKLQVENNTSDVVEVVEVHGKANFTKYSEFLDAWKIKKYIFADFDYLLEIGSSEVKSKFTENIDKLVKSLECKSSADAKALIHELKVVLKKKVDDLTHEDWISIVNLFDYLKSRHSKIINSLTIEDSECFNKFINEQYANNIFVLKKGDIEDYFGGGHFAIEKAIEVSNSLKSDEMPVPGEIRENILKVLN